MKPVSNKVRLVPRSLKTASPREMQSVINGLAEDMKRVGEAHDLHDDALQALPALETRKVVSGVFSSAASGVTSLSMKNPIASKPQHVTLTLRRDDLADFAAAWSWWWLFANEQVTLKFIGLPASVRLVYTVEFF